MPPLDQLGIIAEEEGQEERADMGAVNIGIGHDDDFMVAQLLVIHIAFANPNAHGGNQGTHFLIGKHLVKARLFNVQDFPAQGKDGLRFWIAPLLGRAACGIALNDEQLAFRGVLALAVRKLPGQAEA